MDWVQRRSLAVVPVASMRPSFLRQSMKVSGRHTCSSERRWAATPQRHSTDAAAIIRAVPRLYPTATLARDPVSKSVPSNHGATALPMLVPMAWKNAIASARISSGNISLTVQVG
jgi:hypothetical protein